MATEGAPLRLPRSISVKRVALDLVVLTLAWWAAHLLRFEFAVPSNKLRAALLLLPFVLVVEFAAAYRFGVYRVVARYISLADIPSFGKAALAAMTPMVLVRLLAPASTDWRIPLSITLVSVLFGFAGMLAVRVAERELYESHKRRTPGSDSLRRVLLVGAGHAGTQAVREIRRRGDTGLDVVGFIDGDPTKQGAVLSGVPVLGRVADIPRLVSSHGIDHVIITIVEPKPEALRHIVTICEQVPIKVRAVPGFFEIVQGSVSITKFRDVDVHELLGRDPVDLDSAEVAAFLDHRMVMVTGAGGSIGSEIARQVAGFAPDRLLLVERSEAALFKVNREVLELTRGVEVVPVVADVGDEPRMRSLFERYLPHVVLHAAAHKHVAIMEDNPGEAVKNNALATRLVADLAGEFGASCFVLISTDKAVRPSSVMGASKRVAELVVQHLNARYEGTRYLAVRFGNVMGSSGSVIPIFQEQIERGGPVTVTHRDATRYFMTIPEAVQLVLQAGAAGEGGEIMVLDMGHPIRILDLAEGLIRLSGFEPYDEIPIVFTGLKPGEKLREELQVVGEELARTRHPKIFIGKVIGLDGDVEGMLADLQKLTESGDDEGVRALLAEVLPESVMSSTREAPRPWGDAPPPAPGMLSASTRPRQA